MKTQETPIGEAILRKKMELEESSCLNWARGCAMAECDEAQAWQGGEHTLWGQQGAQSVESLGGLRRAKNEDPEGS